MDTTKRELSEILPQLLEARGITLEKLALSTGVPKRFLTALSQGDLKNLPARPYVRGYLLRIASALDVTPEILLEAYKDSARIPSSDTGDLLPKNRFALKPVVWRNALIFVIVISVLGYLVFELNHVLGIPTLAITSPDTDVVKTGTIRVEGLVTVGDELMLNGEVVYTDESGRFSKEVALDPGLNTLEFSVKRFLGKETKVTKQFFYEIIK